MTNIILLIDDDVRLTREALKSLMRRISVMKQTKHSIKSHRYELVHGEDADFIAYQRKFGDGLWQTVSTWMIPRTECR
jgi:KaiC/GvpD/RAD55 family RecA-like ATPase